MASGQLNTFIRHLRRAVPLAGAGGPTDAQLLERFVQARDEAAFEVLVWRHGTMVLNVCLRVLRREHDAEDAFQATFLALVRKAAAIGKRESVGSWLYKVAYRVALRARTMPAMRSLGDEPLRDAGDMGPTHDLLCREMRSALDEEVQRLPDKYRSAFVLCQLEGQTAAAVAQTLGCPRGTVATRLARAREQLRRRLARRGFDLSALPAFGNVSAALSRPLVSATIKAALFGTADKAVAAGMISARVAALTKGAIDTMSLTKFTLTTALVLTVSLFGGAYLLHRTAAGEPAQGQAAPAAKSSTAEDKAVDVVVFKWKFEEDRPFYQELTTETDMTMTVMGQDVRQTQKQTFYLRWTPIKEERDIWLLKQQFLGAKMHIDIGGNKVEFDSTKDDGENTPLSDFYKALVGAEFKLTLDKENKVSKIGGRDEFVKKMAAANPNVQGILHQVFSESAMRQMADTSFAALLQGPVEPGDSWTRKSKLNIGLGTYETKYKYTYEGKEGKLDKIKVDATLKLQPSAEDEEGPFKIKKADVKSGGTGTILFDRAKGRIVRMELTQKVQGTLTTVLKDQETQVEILQTQKITLKTTDASPLMSRSEMEKELERLRNENAQLKRQLKAVEEALRRDKGKE